MQSKGNRYMAKTCDWIHLDWCCRNLKCLRCGKCLYFIWHNPIHFGTAAILKVFYLITGTRLYFSTAHNV
jgi:hypothetical protein